MRILVTGASGLIGRRLTAKLAERGDEVHALVRDPASVPPEAAAVVVHDLERPLEPRAIPNVDAIVHLAHHPEIGVPEHAVRLHRINAMSTLELLDAGRVHGAGRFLFASSGSVYRSSREPLRETDPRTAGDLYGLSKLHGEQLVEAYADYLEPLIVRPFFPYGPGQSGRLVAKLVELVRAGEPIRVLEGAGPRCNPIFIDDAVRAFLAILDGPAPNVVNVGGAEVVSIAELAEAVGRAVGADPLFEREDGEIQGHFVADIRRMSSLLDPGGFINLEEGIGRTVG